MISEADGEKVQADESAAAATAWPPMPPPADQVLYHCSA